MTTRPAHRSGVLGPMLICGGLLLVPWVLYMAGALPNTVQDRHWSPLWTGLDSAEAVALIAAGILHRRHSRLRALPATVAAVLLAVDAWVDVSTAAPGHATVSATAMAVLVELPAALVCLVVAVRAITTESGAGAAGRNCSRPSGPVFAGTGVSRTLKPALSWGMAEYPLRPQKGAGNGHSDLLHQAASRGSMA